MSLIQPTVGRVVWFYKWNPATKRHEGPLAAHVCKVHTDTDEDLVNLMVIEENGACRGVSKIQLLDPDDDLAPQSDYATWMPYQKGQAQKTQQLESRIRYPDGPKQ